jgi:hypothetical protein
MWSCSVAAESRCLKQRGGWFTAEQRQSAPILVAGDKQLVVTAQFLGTGVERPADQPQRPASIRLASQPVERWRILASQHQ